MSGGALVRLMLLVCAAFAVAGLWSAGTAQPAGTLEAQTREVARTIRCPTCVGESIADSGTPMAGAMRLEIERQLAEGRSHGEVRSWFAERHGDDILLDPPLRGPAAVFWSVPLVVGVAAVVLVARRRHQKERRVLVVGAMLGGAVIAASWIGASALTEPRLITDDERAGGTLEAAVAEAPGDPQLRLAWGLALEEDGKYRQASQQFEAASRLEPWDADTRYLTASTLVRLGELGRAADILDVGLRGSPDHTPSLLLGGLLLWRADDQAGARALLERFVALAPDDPVAEDISALLEGRSDFTPPASGWDTSS